MGVRDATPWLPFRQRRLDESEIYDVLQNDRRRRALLCLREQMGEADLGGLAEAVTRLETAERPIPADRRESVYNSLHQTHLPKLEQLDVVAYDEQDKTVRLTSNAQEVDRYLNRGVTPGLSWGEYYQLLAVTSLLAVLFAELDVSAFAAVEPLFVTTLALLALALTGLYQIWSRRWVYVRSLLS